MKRQKYQIVHVCAATLYCLLVPATAPGQQQSQQRQQQQQQQQGDAFAENLRERSQITTRAIETGPFGGLFGIVRGDHLEGSSRKGSGPMFGRPQQPQVNHSARSGKTRLSLRNPLEGKFVRTQVPPQQRQTAPPTKATQRRQAVPPAKATPPRQVKPPASSQAVPVAPKRTLNTLFAEFRANQAARRAQSAAQASQKSEVRSQKLAARQASAPTPAPQPNKPVSSPAENGKKSGGLLAIFNKGKTSTTAVDEDWSREARQRAAARSAQRQPQSEVQLASLDKDQSGGALGRRLKTPFDSWMGIPKDASSANVAAPTKATRATKAATATKAGTWEQRYVKSDRTSFYLSGKALNPRQPDRHLSRGTPVKMTKRGWNWSNVVLADGQVGTVSTSRLSASRVAPRSTRRDTSAPAKTVGSKPKSKPKTKSGKKTPSRKTPPVDRSDDPLVELANMKDSKPKPKSTSIAKETDNMPSRAALDAMLEPSLESLLDPGVEATLRDLEDELLLPPPPVFAEDVDTGAGMLPSLD